MTSFEELPYPEYDIFTSGCHWIVNPINCVGVMGGGLAADFRKKWPEMNSEYEKLCAERKIMIGHVWIYNDHIVCFPTKVHYAFPSKIQYIVNGMVDLVEQIIASGTKSIGIPKLGCGLGGLDWILVKPIITAALQNIDELNVKLYV